MHVYVQSVISLPGQIELFKEYLEKVKSMAGEEAINDILSKGLFVVATGSNDVTNTYFNNPLRRYHFDFESYSRLLVDSASSFLQVTTIYGLITVIHIYNMTRFSTSISQTKWINSRWIHRVGLVFHSFFILLIICLKWTQYHSSSTFLLGDCCSFVLDYLDKIFN